MMCQLVTVLQGFAASMSMAAMQVLDNQLAMQLLVPGDHV